MNKSALIWITLGLPAAALIFRDGPSPAANTETAPTGAYQDSGWQFQIRYGGFHGTMISPKHFITALHVGGGQTEIHQPIYFNGVEEKNYGIVPGSRTRIGVTDLAVFEIWETFDDYAALYSKSDEVGNEVMVFGRGIGRGAEIANKGWKWGGGATRKSRWGRNEVQGMNGTANNELLFFSFSDLLGQDEAAATSGDSGGGVFIKDGATWKLAGVNFAVDSAYSDAAQPSNANDFRGSFYNAGGLSFGSDAQGWFLLPTQGSSDSPNDIRFYRESHTYFSRISSSLSGIEAIINPAITLAGQTPVERYEAWLSDFGVLSATAPGDDADADGVTNLAEYLSESDPLDPADGTRPFRVQFLSSGDHQFTMVESLDQSGRGLTTVLQSSMDLVNWADVTDAVEASNIVDNSLGVRTRVLARMPSPGAVGDLYYRLKIELN